MHYNNNNKVTIHSQSLTYTNYQISISGAIGEPEDYIEELNTIRNAKEGDTIEIFLNTGGGLVGTAAQFVSVIRSSKATIIAHLESECHSAGTYIALSCDELIVHDNAWMLVHNYSGGAMGKGDDAFKQVSETREWIRSMMIDYYIPFLTVEELDSVFNNNDIYLRASAIRERWKEVIKHRDALAKEANDKMQQELKEKVNSL